MTRSKVFRTAMAALIAMSGALSPAPAFAADPSRAVMQTTVTDVIGDGAAKFVPIGVGKTVVIDLPRDIKDVLVADPKIANAVIRSAQRAYIIGAAVARPISCSSIPPASRLPPMTSRSRAISTACVPR